MTEEEYQVSQEDNSFIGQDDYASFIKNLDDNKKRIQQIIKDLDNNSLSLDIIECVARDLLKESEEQEPLHRFIAKPLLKILKDKNSDLINQIEVFDVGLEISYFISNDWGNLCELCGEYALYEHKTSDQFICQECISKSNKRNSTLN